MIDFAYPLRALGGQIANIHHAAKNIEAANFGRVYTIAYDDYVDYYLVQRAIKPVFDRIASFNHKTEFAIGAGFLLLLILAHPPRKHATPPPVDPNAANPPTRVPAEGEITLGAPEEEESPEDEAGNPAATPVNKPAAPATTPAAKPAASDATPLAKPAAAVILTPPAEEKGKPSSAVPSLDPIV